MTNGISLCSESVGICVNVGTSPVIPFYITGKVNNDDASRRIDLTQGYTGEFIVSEVEDFTSIPDIQFSINLEISTSETGLFLARLSISQTNIGPGDFFHALFINTPIPTREKLIHGPFSIEN